MAMRKSYRGKQRKKKKKKKCSALNKCIKVISCICQGLRQSQYTATELSCIAKQLQELKISIANPSDYGCLIKWMDETPPSDECKLPDKLCEISMEKALDLLHQDVESKLKIEYRRKAKRV